MASLIEILNLQPDITKALITILAVFLFYKASVLVIKKVLFKHLKTKKQQANAYLFMHIWRYFCIFVSLIILLSIFTDSFQWFLSAGFLIAALIWALSKPITSVFAWFLIITKKPFKIGDLISIGGAKGEVYDITLTHIYLTEMGEKSSGEITTGGTVMISNAMIFEQKVVNYTYQDEYVMDSVGILVDYKSNLKTVKAICETAAKNVTKDFLKEIPREPTANITLRPTGILVEVKYYTRIGEKESTSSQISEEIIKEIRKKRIKMANQ